MAETSDVPVPYRRVWFALRRAWRRMTGKSNRHVRRLYATREYLDAYAEHTDIRVRRDPHTAVGGRWHKAGRFAFDLLKQRGMQPHHRMLDIGCGTLRVGRLVTRYLEPSHYTGIDISPGALDYARRLVAREGLAARGPRLVLNEHKRLTFDQFPGETFDYLMMWSVFTHLPRELTDECFAYVGRVMHDDSVFLFTFNESKRYERTSLKQFTYAFAEVEAIADAHGFRLQRGFEPELGAGLQVIVEATKPG